MKYVSKIIDAIERLLARVESMDADARGSGFRNLALIVIAIGFTSVAAIAIA